MREGEKKMISHLQKKKKGKIKKMINVGTLYLCITLHHASSLIMEN